MPKRSKRTGRFVKRGSPTTRRRRRTTTTARPRRRRRNPYAVGGRVVQTNPKRRTRRRTYARKAGATRRRSYRRNPRVLGITMPSLGNVVFAGAGFIAPPMVEGFLSRFVPFQLTGSAAGRWVLRGASVLGLTWGVRRVVGVKESNAILTGGSIYLLVTALSEFAPGLLGVGGTTVPTVEGVSAYTRAIGGGGGVPRGMPPRQLREYVSAVGPSNVTPMEGRPRIARRSAY